MKQVQQNPDRDALVRTILIASSDASLVETICGLIVPTPSSRFTCQTTDSVSSTLAAIEEESVHAILFDLDLNEQDPVATCKAILEKADAPVIVVTRSGSEAACLACLEAGAQEYVAKDTLDSATLRRALGYAISRYRADDLRLRLEHSDRLAALGQLTAGVAHEINNPATYVLSNLSQIEELIDKRIKGTHGEGDLELIAEMARDCRKGIKLIASISRELTMFARSDEDTQVERIDIKELVTNSSTMTLNEIRYRARFEQHIAEDLPSIVGTRSKLGQVLVNLLINAAHAIDSGGTEENTISISASHKDGRAIIEIQDTGCGIPAAASHKIFENYYTTKAQGQGTGLGLPICREIIREHKGSLDFTSTIGEGTTFTISLPVLSDDQKQPRRRSSKSTKTAPRRRILLIDDEPLLLKSLTRMLQAHHQVVAAIGGAKAVETLREDSSFDAIICDLMMPVVDGMHVYETLSSEFPELVPRLVYLSGGVFTKRMTSFLEDRGPKLLDKPVTRDDLLEAIAEIPAREESA